MGTFGGGDELPHRMGNFLISAFPRFALAASPVKSVTKCKHVCFRLESRTSRTQPSIWDAHCYNCHWLLLHERYVMVNTLHMLLHGPSRDDQLAQSAWWPRSMRESQCLRNSPKSSLFCGFSWFSPSSSSSSSSSSGSSSIATSSLEVEAGDS